MSGDLVPVLETGRLRLRAPRASDLDAHAAFMASDRARFVGGPQDRFRSWGGLLAQLGHWAMRGYGNWTVADRATDAPLGRCGFAFHDGWEEPELGWAVFAQAEGKGIAREAVLAARAHGAEALGLDGAISYIAPDNARSRRLAERLGAVHERNGTLLGRPCEVWRHPRLQGEAA